MEDIVIKDLSLSFGEKRVYKDFNLVLNGGEVACIMGVSGCGKTTLLNCICSLLNYSGEIKGVSSASFVFQNARLIKGFTVKENIQFALSQTEPAKREERIKTGLEIMEISDLINKYPFELSGGQQSRVGFARGLACQSNVLLLDEAFTGQDIALRNRIISRLLSSIEKEPRTVIAVTHDVDEALLMADRIIILGDNQVLFDTPIKLDRLDRNLSCDTLNNIRKEVYNALNS